MFNCVLRAPVNETKMKNLEFKKQLRNFKELMNAQFSKHNFYDRFINIYIVKTHIITLHRFKLYVILTKFVYFKLYVTLQY